jgi:hypothetical protein
MGVRYAAEFGAGRLIVWGISEKLCVFLSVTRSGEE